MSGTPCPGCGLVYDLSTYQRGQRCRCRCGQLLIAPGDDGAPRAKIARTVHCSACGGNLEKGRPDCPYCNALVDLTDARMTEYCGECLSMNKEGARFCSECGEPIAAQVEAPEATDAECPRCRVRMRRRTLGEHRPLECPMCCGLFVASADLESLIADQKDDGDAASASQQQPERASLVNESVAYLKCPVCGQIMNRVNYGRISGVIIDSCKEHGHWLDEGELEKIAKWVATGGLAKLRQRELEDLRSERERLSSAQVAAASMSMPMASYGGADDIADSLWPGWSVVRLLGKLIS
jgi:Zn-finger nucleic acid-binding protein